MADVDGNVYGPFDTDVPGSEAEPFTEDAWYRDHDESGVRSGGGLTFDGLTAQLAPIYAFSHGAWLYRETTWTDASPPTVTSQPRRDLLVLRRIRTVGEGEDAIPGRCVPLVLRGTPAATPVNPDRDVATDTRLWSWQVPGSGGATVTAITDHRRDAANDPRWIATMADRPTTDRYLGTRVRPVDDPTRVYIFDGQVWRQEGLPASDYALATAPAGAYIRRERTSVVITLSSPGTGRIVWAKPFSGSPAPPVMTIGSEGGNVFMLRPIEWDGVDATFRARRSDGSLVPTGQDVRVNYDVVGWNT